MGDVADAVYLHYINLGRHGEHLATDPERIRIIATDTPAKFAVLLVLSKNCLMSAGVVRVLLQRFGYTRSAATIRRALHRCEKFGFVVMQTNLKREYGVLKGKRNHRHNKWGLTERGRQMACSSPPKVLKKKKERYVYAK